MRVRSCFPALLLAVATPLTAQSAQRWSVQASGISVGVYGDAYEGLQNGLGAEAQVRYTPGLWSFGGGLQFSSHGFTEVDGESVMLAGLFFEPRRVLDIGSGTVAPYVSGRFAILRQSASVDVGIGRLTRPGNPDLALAVAAQQARAALNLSATGFQGNVGGGVLWKLSPRVNFDLGATLGVIRFGRVDGDIDGTPIDIDGTAGTGQNLVVRAGLAIGLGGGRTAKAPSTPPTRRR